MGDNTYWSIIGGLRYMKMITDLLTPEYLNNNLIIFSFYTWQFSSLCVCHWNVLCVADDWYDTPFLSAEIFLRTTPWHEKQYSGGCMQLSSSLMSTKKVSRRSCLLLVHEYDLPEPLAGFTLFPQILQHFCSSLWWNSILVSMNWLCILLIF